ncbi:unnamed protein product [Hyaloperonospora brassicae]|uniref:Mediator complex subunit 15 KIX domain-containing protein n=1 Tax=Hyaloperonospora brassicae TaxID=162125 RepID=A0AAV0TYF6_HYABA|nr:unnamed protein product [Hyaloperonospora brassicae]
MDPLAVNAFRMRSDSLSMPMSMAMMGTSGSNSQAMAMSINAMNVYNVPQRQQQQQHQHQQMMVSMGSSHQMNTASMEMNMGPTATKAAAPPLVDSQPAAAHGLCADWRIQFTREHRANLIAKIYNEMVRVSADPVPGIKLWMNMSWCELALYKEARTQEEYIDKIFTRLKSLRAQQTDMNAVMAAQTLLNQGMLSRLDFSYCNTLNLSQRANTFDAQGGQAGGFPGHTLLGGQAVQSSAQQSQLEMAVTVGAGGMSTTSVAPNGTNITPRVEKPEGSIPGDTPAEYWRQHAALKLKYHDDVKKVHSAFQKYADHMRSHDETEQKKKLRYLLSYVQLCADILNEDRTTHAPRKIEELDKVYKYIVKIVNPYLKKLRAETDRRSIDPNAVGGNPAGMNPATVTNPTPGARASLDADSASGETWGVPNSAMHVVHRQQSQVQPRQNLALQQKQQQYLMQQRAQQCSSSVKPNQSQLPAQQQANLPNLPNERQNGRPLHAQQTSRRLEQQPQRAQQAPNTSRQQLGQPQRHASQQSHQPRQPHQQQHQRLPQRSHSQEPKTQPSVPQHQQQQHQTLSSVSRAETSSLSFDDTLYRRANSRGTSPLPSSMGSSRPSSNLVHFSSDLSPTSFSSMELLDMDGFMARHETSSTAGEPKQKSSQCSVRNSANAGNNGDSDLMFMEAL